MSVSDSSFFNNTEFSINNYFVNVCLKYVNMHMAILYSSWSLKDKFYKNLQKI